MLLALIGTQFNRNLLKLFEVERKKRKKRKKRKIKSIIDFIQYASSNEISFDQQQHYVINVHVRQIQN